MADTKDSKMGENKGDHSDSEITYSTEHNQVEKFPSLATHRKSSLQKSKSMTSTEITTTAIAMIEPEDMSAAVNRLKTEEPPASLEEVRQRRASIKQQRRDSINLIRNRTASRASAMGRPILDATEKAQQASEG